jgi:hypothetical protein
MMMMMIIIIVRVRPFHDIIWFGVADSTIGRKL